MSTLSLFPARVRFTNADGTLTPEAYRSLQTLLARVGGLTGDTLTIFANNPVVLFADDSSQESEMVIPGPRGATGEAGQRGQMGMDGQDGEDGAAGPMGPQGAMGAAGTSASILDDDSPDVESIAVSFGLSTQPPKIETTAGFLVAGLPAAGSAGRRAYVTNALAPVFGSTVAGGGAVSVPVFDNGTNWIVG